MNNFEDNVVKAESMYEKLISLKIMLLLFLAVIVLIALYGQWFTAGLLFILFMYYRALINKYKKTIFEMMEVKKNRKKKEN
jgi:hypothetical protein